jgi:hypothetical protein
MSSHSPEHEHEHEQKSKAHQPHPEHEDHSPASKGPHDPNEINPKLSSDIAYWSHEFGVSGEKLHDAIRTHGTHVAKVRAALHK